MTLIIYEQYLLHIKKNKNLNEIWKLIFLLYFIDCEILNSVLVNILAWDKVSSL